MKLYKGKNKFDKDQLSFVVEVMLTACVDAVESSLPQTPYDVHNSRHNKETSLSILSTSLYNLGLNLSILYANITDDGMSVEDALDIVDIERKIKTLINLRFSDRWKGFDLNKPIHNIYIKTSVNRFINSCFDHSKI
jgi:hypothetical protein